MGTIYERADIYDLAHTEQKDKILTSFYKDILSNKDIHHILDVSIGSGNLTLPLVTLGYEVSGSDLSQDMLKRCEEKANQKGLCVDLKVSDFRTVNEAFHKKFDLVMSTGNSLPYVEEDDVWLTLKAMDQLVNENGYLYIDVRNWDKIVAEKQRFYLYNPFFVGDTRVNITQVWDHHEDESVTFNILYTFEENHKIYQKEIFQEYYHPLYRDNLCHMIRKLGYEIVELDMFPKLKAMPIEATDWYFILARKSE